MNSDASAIGILISMSTGCKVRLGRLVRTDHTAGNSFSSELEEIFRALQSAHTRGISAAIVRSNSQTAIDLLTNQKEARKGYIDEFVHKCQSMDNCFSGGVAFEFVPTCECVPNGGFEVAQQLARRELRAY